MADSKLLKPHQTSKSVDLVQCGICYAVIDKPKALPCLHTFCLMCLTSWAESAAKKNPSKFVDEISCPTCRETFPLPSNGVKGLRTNFFITKLKEKHSIRFKLDLKEVPITCSSCSTLSNNSAIARCIDCNDFLCEHCVKGHEEMRILKDHKLFTLDELRSGQLTMPNVKEQEVCSKHKGEILRYHCETCDEPACRECVTLNHPHPEHKYSDLKTVADRRGEDLKELAKCCEDVVQEIDMALEGDEKLIQELEAAIEQTKFQHMWLTDELKSKILAIVAEYSARITRDLSKLENDRKSGIEKNGEELKLKRARLEYALNVTHQLIHNGSEHDVVTTYASLSHILKQLREFKPKMANQSMASVKLPPIDEEIKTLGILGQFKSCGNWVVQNVLKVEGSALHVVSTSKSIIVGTTSHIYKVGLDGKVLAKFETKKDHYGHSRSNQGMAVNKDGHYLVLLGSPSSVMSLDTTKEYPQFKEIIKRERDSCYFAGMAIDSNERVIVGGYNGSRPSDSHTGFIKTYKDGTCEDTFATSITPSHLAVTQQGHIIVTGRDQKSQVHVYSAKGALRHIFELPDVKAHQYFCFESVCCTRYNEVYVAGRYPPAIYRYSLTGDYLGIVTKELTSPGGIALRDDDNELIVADENQVKVFQLG